MPRLVHYIPWMKWAVPVLVTVLGLLVLLAAGNPRRLDQPRLITSSKETQGPRQSSSYDRRLSKRDAELGTTPADGDTSTLPASTPNGTSENDTHSSLHSHGGVHVADWRWEYVKTPFIYTAFVIAAGLCKIGYHHADFLSSIIPESCLLIVLGTAVGSILFVTGSETLLPQFDSRTFFLFLLPPIVLESAYSLHDRAFFSNLGTILLYAVVGTLLNCFTIGPTLYGLYSVGALGENLNLGALECLVFSSLISAVDPVAVLAIFQEVGVHKALYFLVFGESLLNDAVTVVLYTMMVALSTESHVTAGQLGLGVVSFFCVSLGGLAIGILMGTLTALVTKKTNNVRVVEPLAMLGVAYLAYLLAEMVHFSGIISIIGCGLVQAQYAWCNISQKSYTTVKYFSKMLSAVCDTVIFLFLGMVLVNDHHVFNIGFVLWTTLLCLIYRFMGVLVLTYVTNRFDRVRRINLEEQFIMAYGGLRGAVAFSLVIMLDKESIPNKDMFVTTTLFIILFTVFIQGGTIKPLVNLLKIRLQTSQKHSLFGEINTKVVDSVMAGIEEITGSHGDNYWKHVLFKYDEKYLKKWLQRDCHDNALTRVYTKLVLADHFAHLYGPATAIEDNQPLQLLSEDNCIDDEILVACAPLTNDLKLGGIESRRMSAAASIGTPPPTRGSSRRRNTIVSPISSLRRRGTTAAPTDDPRKLLQSALQHNPYNKFHLKYNPNLVEDDNQELLMHLRARRLRARRLTLAAMNSLGSSTTSSTEDLRLHSAASDAIDRVMTAPSIQLSPSPKKAGGSPINDRTISFLLDRANRRRSVMSGRAGSLRMERSNTVASEPSTESEFTRSAKGFEARKKQLVDQDKRLNTMSSDGKLSLGSLDSISEIGGGANSASAANADNKDGEDKKFKKSLTFDVSDILGSEDGDQESKF